MTVVDIPRASVDLAPGLPSRIVYGTVLAPTEDRGPKAAWIEVSIPGEIKVPGQETTVTGRSARVPLNVDGTFAVRLPTASEGIEPEDWALSVKMSWRPVAFPMLVPTGQDPIWIEDCVFPALVPGEDPSMYFLSGAQIRTVETLPPGSAATAKASVVGGMLSIDLGLPQGPQGLPGVTAIEGDEAVAGYISTTGTSATRDALMTTLTTVGTRPVGKGEIVLNARDMGALGDGVADDTAALQAALDASAGRDVFIPHGEYRITSTLTVPSEGVVRGENGTVLINDADLPTMLQWNGFVEQGRQIAAAVGVGDRVITTASAHGFAAGDVVQFQSQRVATSDDAGDWRLGFATVGGPGPFFGEFGTVQNVIDATTFELDTGLIFPDYRPDNSQETDPDAGAFATVAKVRAARNIVISNLTLEGPAYMAIRGIRGVDCLIENVRYTKYDEGRFIGLHECYRTKVRNCWVSNELDVTPGLGHARVNSYHLVSCQSTGFDGCEVISGTQGFDITYSNAGRIPSSFCYVRNCSSYAALANSMTVHPGTYQPIIAGNNFSENRGSGISIRGNRAIVTGNVVRGSGGDTGLYLMEGGGKDSLVSSNHISNFDIGMAVRDGADKPFAGWIGITFANNYVADCVTGYTRFTGWLYPLPTTTQGITLSGNTFVSSRPGAVGVETCSEGRPMWGLTIQGNSFRLTGGASTVAIRTNTRSRDVAVLGNTIWEAGRELEVAAGTSTEWNIPCTTEYTGNIAYDTVYKALSPSTPKFKMKSQDMTPLTVHGDVWHLDDFTETIRFRMITTSAATSARGFPAAAAGLPCEVRVSRHTSASVIQEIHVLSSGEMHHRRLNGSTWGAWSKRY